MGKQMSTEVSGIFKNCSKLPEAYGTILNVPDPVNSTENLLKNVRALYKCLKHSHNCFKLPEASRVILKVP